MSKEITATQMAKKSGLKNRDGAIIINNTLKAMKYMTQDESGYHITELAQTNKGEPFGTEKIRAGKSYVVWNEATLENKKFLSFLEKELAKKDSVKKDFVKKDFVKKETPSKKRASTSNKVKYPQKFETGIKPPFQHDRDFQNKETNRQISIAEFMEDWDEVNRLKKLIRRPIRTRQGFMVKSLGECMILDELLRNKFIVCYETQLEETEGVVYGDFFMEMDVNGKKYKIMFELWGYENDPKYLSRKEDKIKLYEESGIVLIGLDYQDVIYDLDSTFFRTCNAHPVLKDLRLTLKEMRKINSDAA